MHTNGLPQNIVSVQAKVESRWPFNCISYLAARSQMHVSGDVALCVCSEFPL